MVTVSEVRRRSGVPYNAIRENVDERAVSSLSSLPRSFLLSVARARPRAGRGVESRRAGHLFPCLCHLAARVHDYDAPVPYKIPLERELRGLGHAVGSREPLSFSPARIVRGGGRARARARAAPRDHGRYAVDPRAAAAAAARNRVNASPVVLLVHLGRRPGRRETAGLSSFPSSSSRIGSSTIRRGFGGGPRLARARHGRTSNDRSYARARCGGAQAVFGYLNDPQPGVVRELYPWTAMCVRNVDVHVSCSSQVDAQLAAFFIDPRAK